MSCPKDKTGFVTVTRAKGLDKKTTKGMRPPRRCKHGWMNQSAESPSVLGAIQGKLIAESPPLPEAVFITLYSTVLPPLLPTLSTPSTSCTLILYFLQASRKSIHLGPSLMMFIPFKLPLRSPNLDGSLLNCGPSRAECPLPTGKKFFALPEWTSQLSEDYTEIHLTRPSGNSG